MSLKPHLLEVNSSPSLSIFGTRLLPDCERMMHAVAMHVARMRAEFYNSHSRVGDDHVATVCSQLKRGGENMHATNKSFQNVLERDMGPWQRRSKRAAAALSVAAKLMSGMATGTMATGAPGGGGGAWMALHVQQGVPGSTEMVAWAARRGVRAAAGVEDPCATFLMVKRQVITD